jgi:outer membrane protein TolC
MMKKLIQYFLLAVTMLSCYPAAAGNQHYPDSLLSYLETAAANNPLVQQKLLEYQAALRKIPQAGSLPDPELSAGIFLMPMELVGGRQYAELTIMQMFPWFGVLRNAKDEMSLMANARFEEFRQAKLQLFYEVQSSWYELYKVRKEISVSDENAEILKSIEQIALVRFRASPGTGSPAVGSGNYITGSPYGSTGSGGSSGRTQVMNRGSDGSQGSMGSMKSPGGTVTTGSLSAAGGDGADMGMPSGASGNMGSMGGSQGSGLTDLYRIQIEKAELLNSIELLKDREKTLIARLNGYMNRFAGTPVYTVEEAMADTIGLPLVAIHDSIDIRNPALAMLDYEKEAWEARGRMAGGMGYPMTGLGISYSPVGRSSMSASEMNGKDMIMPMISITLPVYRKKYRAMREEADLMLEAVSLNRQSAAISLQNDYYEAIRMYNDAKRRRGLYETQYILASRSLDIVLKGYTAATADLTDVLRLRQQTLDYNLNTIRAVADLNIAVARLNQLMASDITLQTMSNEKE